jgi:hypothetical protein
MKEQGVAADVKFMNPKCSDGQQVDCYKRCKCPCSEACNFSMGASGASCREVSSLCAPRDVFNADNCNTDDVQCEFYDAKSKSWSPMSAADAAAASSTLGREIRDCCVAAARDGKGSWGEEMLAALHIENRQRLSRSSDPAAMIRQLPNADAVQDSIGDTRSLPTDIQGDIEEFKTSSVSTHGSGFAGQDASTSSRGSTSSLDSPDMTQDELMSLLESEEGVKAKGFSCW